MDAGKVIIETELENENLKKDVKNLDTFLQDLENRKTDIEMKSKGVDETKQKVTDLFKEIEKLQRDNSPFATVEIMNLNKEVDQVLESLEKQEEVLDGSKKQYQDLLEYVEKLKVESRDTKLINPAQLEKDVAKAESEIERLTRQRDALLQQQARAELKLDDYHEALDLQREVTDELLQYSQTEQEVNKWLEAEKRDIAKINYNYRDKLMTLDQVNAKLDENASRLGVASAKSEILKSQLDKTSTGPFSNLGSHIDKVGNSITKAIKKTGRWVIALFGVRSAYFAIRQAMSTISQYDKQLAADIEYIKNALAFALEPIIRKIIELVKKLLFYLGYIIKAWTGKNIFASANKGLEKATGSAKELKKQLAGFDEMEVLNDSSGGGEGITAPSMDLTNLEGDVPGWIKWIADNGDLVQSILFGIATALIAVKLGLDPLKALGVGLLAGGLLYTIKSFLDYLKDPTFTNFGKIIEGIGVALIGLAIIVSSVTLGIVGGVVLVFGIITKYWEEIKAFLQKGIDWLVGKSDWVHEHLGNTIGTIYDSIVAILQNLLNWFDDIFTNIKKIFDGFIKFFKGVFTGQWKLAWQGLKDIVVGLWNIIVSTIKNALNIIKNIVIAVVTTAGNIIAGMLKAVVNGVLYTIEAILNFPIKAINKLIKVINKVPGVNIGKIPTFDLPKLAKGGIVNMPGKGVPVGNAITGERGAEGVIPLTDSQQMALLGEAIGRYITVNANITNTMNGRVISRELQKVQNNSDFAYNR